MADSAPDPVVEEKSADLAGVAFVRLREVLDTSEKQRQIAAVSGLPVPTLKDYASGRTSPPIDRFLLIAAAAGRQPGWFFTPDVNPEAEAARWVGIDPEVAARAVAVRVMNVQAAAGSGRFNDMVRQIDTMPWPRAFFEKIGASPTRTESLRAAGDSMWPTIEDGALLLVDRSQDQLGDPPKRRRGQPLQQDPIFIFIQGNDLRIKRLRRLASGFLALLSDNQARHPPEIVDREEAKRVKLIGKVVWWDNRL